MAQLTRHNNVDYEGSFDSRGINLNRVVRSCEHSGGNGKGVRIYHMDITFSKGFKKCRMHGSDKVRHR